MKTIYLIEKWSISRGVNTQGYNICSLFKRKNGWSLDQTKVASCNGGGYDMQGVSFANFLMFEYQDRLLKLDAGNGLYFTTNKKGVKYAVLEGATGLSTMETIARQIGLEVSRLNIDANKTLITIRDKQEE